MLRLYTGEFLINPVPIHLGLNYCSNNCWFCFANLNQSKRRADYRTAYRFITRKNHKQCHGLLDHFLNSGYPILCANDSDPFCKSNLEGFFQVHSALREVGCRFVYQTRGGDDTIIKFLLSQPKTMIYVSICSDKEELTKENEPGTCSIAERFELIDACVKYGHHVILGLNPLMPFWFDDFQKFIGRIYDLGIRYVWYGSLHLSSQQIENIPISIQKKHKGEIRYARLRKKSDQKIMDYFLKIMGLMGINCFAQGTSCKGHFWEPYFKLGYPFFPTLDGWFDELRKFNPEKPVIFSFDDLMNWSGLDGLPSESSQTKNYLCSFLRSILGRDHSVRATNFRDVMKYYWRILDFPTPLKDDTIAFVSDGKGRIRAENGMDLFAYLPPEKRIELVVKEKNCVRYERG